MSLLIPDSPLAAVRRRHPPASAPGRRGPSLLRSASAATYPRVRNHRIDRIEPRNATSSPSGGGKNERVASGSSWANGETRRRSGASARRRSDRTSSDRQRRGPRRRFVVRPIGRAAHQLRGGRVPHPLRRDPQEGRAGSGLARGPEPGADTILQRRGQRHRQADGGGLVRMNEIRGDGDGTSSRSSERAPVPAMWDTRCSPRTLPDCTVWQHDHTRRR